MTERTAISLQRQVVNIALPAFGSLVAPPLFLLVDAAIVGSLGTSALAALGAGSAVFSAIVGLSFFLAYQTTGVVSRHRGAGDEATGLQLAGANLVTGIALGTVLGIFLFLAAGPLIDLVGVDASARTEAIAWLHGISPAMPGALGAMAAVGLFRGYGNTTTPLYITLIQVALNALLCAYFILVADFGVIGSAYATSIAELAGLAMYLFAVSRAVPGGLKSLMPNQFGALWSSLKDGAPLIWRSVMLRGVLSGIVIAAAHLGVEELAAFHVSYVVWYTLALSLDAIAIAAQTLIGIAIGNKNYENARQTLSTLLRWGMWLGLAQGIATALAAPLIAQLFSQDQAVADLIITALWMVALHQPLAAVVFVLDGVLIGAGDTRFLARVHTVGFAIFVPLAYAVVAMNLSLIALWSVMILFISVRAVMLYSRSRSSEWMLQA